MRAIDTDSTTPFLVDSAQDISIDEVAELLDVRPEDIRELIDQGKLATVGSSASDRKVLILTQSVLDLRKGVESNRHRHLAELIRLSQEYGLYDIDYGPDFGPEGDSEPVSN